MFNQRKKPSRPTFQVDLPLHDGDACLVLPTDLTTGEAEKICEVLRSIAVLTDRGL